MSIQQGYTNQPAGAFAHIHLIREATPIVRKLVSDEERLNILPKYSGQHFMTLESQIYQVMGEYCEDYNGGYWDMWELSNGTFYMTPLLAEEKVTMVGRGNYFEGAMSLDAAGIVACLVAFNRLAWSVPEPEHFNELFYGLRDWALQHEECGSILAAID